MNTQLTEALDKIDLKTEMPEPLPPPEDTGADPAPPPRDLWDRQPGESSAAFALFTQFLELGADSTLADLAEKTGRTLTSIRHMSGRHNWTERAAAWRQHLAHAAHEAREQVARDEALLWSSRSKLARELAWELGLSLGNTFRNVNNLVQADPKASIPLYALTKLSESAIKLLRIAADPSPAQFSAATGLKDNQEASFQKGILEVFGDSTVPLTAPASSPAAAPSSPDSTSNQSNPQTAAA